MRSDLISTLLNELEFYSTFCHDNDLIAWQLFDNYILLVDYPDDCAYCYKDETVVFTQKNVDFSVVSKPVSVLFPFKISSDGKFVAIWF